MAKKEFAIRVESVSKTFKLPHEKQNSLKGLFVNVFRRNKTYELQKALQDISFEIKQGEFFGIVGRNGGGKSTLLKILAGIYQPTEGKVNINGKLVPFIELGVGFNPELTGRENVYLNGALLGFNRKEVASMYKDIVEFAELERFMDQKLKNYSSGMQVRLAFSIAIRAQSNILVLDEVLAVGDASFQQKCNEYFEKIKKSQQTVVLVSHDMKNITRFCDRVLLIDNGAFKAIGDPTEIANQYTLDNLNAESNSGGSSVNADDGSSKKLGNQIKNLEIVPKSSLLLTSNKDSFIFEIQYELNRKIPVDIGISILYQNTSLIEHNTKQIEVPHESRKINKLTYELPLDILNSGRYRVDVAIFNKKSKTLIGFNSDSCNFVLETGIKQGGVLSKKGRWIQ